MATVILYLLIPIYMVFYRKQKTSTTYPSPFSLRIHVTQSHRNGKFPDPPKTLSRSFAGLQTIELHPLRFLHLAAMRHYTKNSFWMLCKFSWYPNRPRVRQQSWYTFAHFVAEHAHVLSPLGLRLSASHHHPQKRLAGLLQKNKSTKIKQMSHKFKSNSFKCSTSNSEIWNPVSRLVLSTSYITTIRIGTAKHKWHWQS